MTSLEHKAQREIAISEIIYPAECITGCTISDIHQIGRIILVISVKIGKFSISGYHSVKCCFRCFTGFPGAFKLISVKSAQWFSNDQYGFVLLGRSDTIIGKTVSSAQIQDFIIVEGNGEIGAPCKTSILYRCSPKGKFNTLVFEASCVGSVIQPTVIVR